MICPNCGKERPDNTTYCGRCGASLTGHAQSRVVGTSQKTVHSAKQKRVRLMIIGLTAALAVAIVTLVMVIVDPFGNQISHD